METRIIYASVEKDVMEHAENPLCVRERLVLDQLRSQLKPGVMEKLTYSGDIRGFLDEQSIVMISHEDLGWIINAEGKEVYIDRFECLAGLIG